ncbi:hypothetical protein EVAR_13905_1 [Eumeta japonica]|uniref:Uncharacterized protein n=1 Tax=Eumeta variegata TaxID=151549 RepID=A0A4C1U8C0_EUMVA|nr:hypothetical protein EVAR_13905_1 [Eumeta japonica]
MNAVYKKDPCTAIEISNLKDVWTRGMCYETGLNTASTDTKDVEIHSTAMPANLRELYGERLAGYKKGHYNACRANLAHALRLGEHLNPLVANMVVTLVTTVIKHAIYTAVNRALRVRQLCACPQIRTIHFDVYSNNRQGGHHRRSLAIMAHHSQFSPPHDDDCRGSPTTGESEEEPQDVTSCRWYKGTLFINRSV